MFIWDTFQDVWYTSLNPERKVYPFNLQLYLKSFADAPAVAILGTRLKPLTLSKAYPAGKNRDC